MSKARSPIERMIDDATGYREPTAPAAVSRAPAVDVGVMVADEALDHLERMYPQDFARIGKQAKRSLRGFITNKVALVVKQERER